MARYYSRSLRKKSATHCKKCGGQIVAADGGKNYGLCFYCYEDEANACAVHDGQIGRAVYEKMHKALEKAAGRELPRNL